MLLLYAAAILGVVWVVIALLGQFNPDFVLHQAFRDLGFLFWIAFTALGLALVGTLSWAFLSAKDEAPAPTAASPAYDARLEPVSRAPGWNPLHAPTEERTTCVRCSRILPPWRMPEGTCTVCAPFSVFLDKPRQPNAELDKRRNQLFILQGLGFALLALAFISAVYLFPILLAPQRPVFATLGFLVFSPMLFGLILLMYAHSQHKPDAAE